MYDVPTYFADGFIIGKIYSAATNDPVIRDQHIIRLYFSIQIITQINFFFRRKIFWCIPPDQFHHIILVCRPIFPYRNHFSVFPLNTLFTARIRGIHFPATQRPLFLPGDRSKRQGQHPEERFAEDTARHLEVPSVRSAKMIGTSPIRNPIFQAVYFISIWNPYPTISIRSKSIAASTSRL